jgi:hypothetical protein
MIFLGLVMEAGPYFICAGVMFEAPGHPGSQPLHSATATQSQITEANHLNNAP